MKRVTVPVLIAAAVAASAMSATSATGTTAYKRCPDVLVRLQPEGEGGAGSVRVRGASCSAARTTLRRCILSGPPRGWKIRLVRTSGRRADRTALTRGAATIRFTFAGGGICAPGAA